MLQFLQQFSKHPSHLMYNQFCLLKFLTILQLQDIMEGISAATDLEG